MNPVLQSALSGIIRFCLAYLTGYLVRAGVWHATDAETYVTAATLALLTLGWSLWEKHHDRLKFLVALMLPHGSTENDVNAKVAIGHLPSVLTAKNEIPTLPSVVA